MIVDESKACRVHDTFTIIHRNMATETDVLDVKKNSYAASSPDSSQYSRAAKSVLEESDDEEDEDGMGELSRNPSLVDDSFFHDEEDERDDEPADSVNEQHLKKSNYCVPTGNPICHGEFPMLSGCHLDFPMLPGCQGNSLAEQLDMMTVRSLTFVERNGLPGLIVDICQLTRIRFGTAMSSSAWLVFRVSG